MLYTSLKARRATPRHAHRSSRRLQLERLEDRVVPSHAKATSLIPGGGSLTHLTGIIFHAKASTGTALSSSVTPSVFGKAVTFTATINILSLSAGTPTGTVQFQIDGANAGSPVSLSTTGHKSTATFSTASLGVGTHAVTASYSGDSSFATSSGTLSGGQAVNQAATTVTVSSSANPSVSGQSVTFTATVRVVAPGAGAPTGTVQFQIDGSNAGSPVSLGSGGIATFSTATLKVGTHTITASYSGDSSFASSSGSLTQMVNDVLAGNVTALLNVSGVLTIIGDAGNNAITIQQNAAGSLQVAGVGGTLVNQSSNPASFTLSSVTEIDVFLQSGNDSVAMNNFNISGNSSLIQVIAGSGSDTFLLDTITAKKIVIAATGPDAVSVRSATADGLGIIIGPGSQSVSVTGTTCMDLLIQAHSAPGDNTSFTLVNDMITDIAGGLALSDSPGAGSDTVTLSHLTVAHQLAVVLSGGVNTVSADNVTAAFGFIDGGEPDSGGNLYFDGGRNLGYFVVHFVGH